MANAKTSNPSEPEYSYLNKQTWDIFAPYLSGSRFSGTDDVASASVSGEIEAHTDIPTVGVLTIQEKSIEGESGDVGWWKIETGVVGESPGI